MSGKKKSASWGGARAGSGQKKIKKTVSDKVKKNWMDAARKIAKETGVTIEEYALRIVIDPKAQSATKVGILKLYTEALIVRESSSQQTVKVTKVGGPAIGLPPMKEDPALKVVNGGKE